MRKHPTTLFILIFCLPLSVLADDGITTVTVIGTPDSTMNDNPWYHSGSSPAPSGGYGGYGSSYAAAMAAKKQACLTGVAQHFSDSCKQQSQELLQKNLQACNNQTIFGGLIGFTGAAGVGLATALLSGPPGWIVGTIAFGTGLGGTWYGLDGQTNCRDSASASYDYNVNTACPTWVKKAQDTYCQ